MNEREAEKYVKKDNIWKKPDYQAMVDEGIPLGVVYYIKKVRDCLPASPRYPYGDNTPEKRLARQKEYIETVRQLEAVMKDVRTVEDAMKACDRFMVGNGYLSRVPIMGGSARYMVEKKGRDNPAVTDKLFTTLHIRSTDQFEWHFTKKAQSEQFGVPKERKVPRGYSIRYYDGENSYDICTIRKSCPCPVRARGCRAGRCAGRSGSHARRARRLHRLVRPAGP